MVRVRLFRFALVTYKEAFFSDDAVSSIDHAFKTGAAGKPHVEQSQKICLEIKKKMVHLVQMACHDRFRNISILKVTTFKINYILHATKETLMVKYQNQLFQTFLETYFVF